MRSLLLSLLILIFLSACTPAPAPEKVEEVGCTPPFIKAREGCCLDENNNYICDRDEVEEVTEELKEGGEGEEVRIQAGSKWRVTENDLPKRIFMQRNSRILYRADGEEYAIILDEVDRSKVTVFYGQNRYKIDVGRTKPAGPLLIKYEGTDPPKGGNFAILYLQQNLN